MSHAPDGRTRPSWPTPPLPHTPFLWSSSGLLPKPCRVRSVLEERFVTGRRLFDEASLWEKTALQAGCGWRDLCVWAEWKHSAAPKVGKGEVAGIPAAEATPSSRLVSGNNTYSGCCS